MTADAKRKLRFTRIILACPLVLILAGIAINMALFGVGPAVVSLPPKEVVVLLVLGAVLLFGNHTWLMTSTELTRLRYDLHATPEEWAGGSKPGDAPTEGLRGLERRHNANRNATENTVLFVLAALVLSAGSS